MNGRWVNLEHDMLGHVYATVVGNGWIELFVRRIDLGLGAAVGKGDGLAVEEHLGVPNIDENAEVGAVECDPLAALAGASDRRCWAD